MKPQTLVHARRLELAALALFVAAALVGLLASGWAHALLAAFSVTALAYAALVAAALQSCEESDLPTLAARHDQRAPLILCFGLLLDFASLALVVTLMATRTMDVYATALAGLSIASAWVLLNMLFAIYYAHVFFTSEETQPLSFPGGRPPVFSGLRIFFIRRRHDVSGFRRGNRRFALRRLCARPQPACFSVQRLCGCARGECAGARDVTRASSGGMHQSCRAQGSRRLSCVRSPG